MEPPGNPGVFGAVIAGAGITIGPDGSVNIPGAPNIVGVDQLIAGDGIELDPPEGTGNVRISIVSNRDPFYGGTSLISATATAPPGWVKQTVIDNYALRVSSAGGDYSLGRDFSSVFASQTPTGSFPASSISSSGNTETANFVPTYQAVPTLTGGNNSMSDLYNPAHTHSFVIAQDSGGGAQPVANAGGMTKRGSVTSNSKGTNTAHSHGISGTPTVTFPGIAHAHAYTASGTGSPGTYNGTAINLSVKYVDAIIIVKQ